MAEESTNFSHQAVMVGEISSILGAVPTGVVVDATVGGGGHAEALLAARGDLDFVGFDQDPAALDAAADRLARFGSRVRLRHTRFDHILEVIHSLGYDGVAGVLFDLGVSSPQLDQADRGFSYRAPGPLDMRMDPGAPRRADDVVNHYDRDDLARVLRDFGDERYAGRIASAIVAARPISDTGMLADVVVSAIPAPARRTGGHPARRTFQAIRIEVNAELEILAGAIDDAISLLVPGGRIAVLAYHSGEDRIVKQRLRWAATGGCRCPAGLPCACGAIPMVRLVKRGATRPTPAEVAANPRAESARLRAAERLAVEVAA